MNINEVRGYIKALEECCLQHPPVVNISQHIASVNHFIESENDGPSGIVIGQLDDGRWFSCTDNQDYTGHG